MTTQSHVQPGQTQGTLFVVDSECSWSADHSTAIIVVESTSDNFPQAIDELKDAAARNLAVSYAAKNGIADPSINDIPVGPYAINCDGKPIEGLDPAMDKLPPDHPKKQPVAYRTEIKVTRRMR